MSQSSPEGIILGKGSKLVSAELSINKEKVLTIKKKNTRRVFTQENGWQDERVYTEEDMKECWDASVNYNKPAGFDSGINFKEFLKNK